MKTPLTLITAPLALSFLTGIFDWQVDEGMFLIFGLSMIVGTIWAWVIESNR
jgi:hypothetical protein